MTTYRTNFKRINFYFDPPLVQSSDVVFETNIPFDDEHCEAFESVAWDAMWKQNPHWSKVIELDGTGWSTVLGNGKYTISHKLI